MIDIVFLGTGSAMPMAGRNLSGVALIRQGEIFLLDCGEGTQMQFRRAGLKPGRVRYLLISHFHGDHLFGLPGFLTSLQMCGCREEIHLFAPRGISQYLNFHHELCKFGLDFPLRIHEIHDSSDRTLLKTDEFHLEWQPLKHRIFTTGYALVEADRPGKFDVETANRIGVPNGPERGLLQRGESITLANGRRVSPSEVMGPPRPGVKIAYCVDTSPCEGEEKLASDADAMIADSTFTKADQDWAHQTGHSTASDSATAAKRCNVQRLFLTHFSGTLGPDDLPGVGQEAATIFADSTVATDLARYTIQPREVQKNSTANERE